jgi:hypothetical protein
MNKYLVIKADEKLYGGSVQTVYASNPQDALETMTPLYSTVYEVCVPIARGIIEVAPIERTVHPVELICQKDRRK